MGAWQPFGLDQLFPTTVATALSTLGSAISSLASELKAAVAVASPGSGLPGGADPIGVAAAALASVVDGLVHAGKLHVLFVPIAKTYPAPVAPPLPPTLDELQDSLDVDLGPRAPTADAAYARMTRGGGGNAGFYAAFAQSLADPFDPDRPQYLSQNDAVAMSVVLVGESTFAGISQATGALDSAFGAPPGASLGARVVPTPQGLRARPIGVPKASRIGIRLDWDPPRPPYASPYFPGVSIGVVQYALIRSTDARAAQARTVLDFFPAQALVVGMTGGAAGQHVVVAVGTGANSAYLDDDASLDASTPYYYCVAWSVAVDEGGTVTALPFDKVSNVVKVAPRAPAPAQTGVAPNWTAVGSAVEIVPSLAAGVERLLSEIGVLSKTGASPIDRLRAAIATGADAATRLSARAADVADVAARVQASFGKTLPALYSTTMTSETGGNAFLLSELSTRLGDLSDPTRPPFDHGEYVCGLCFVAGAPRLADLAAAIAFLEALFGPAESANPLMAIVAAIDTAVTQAETALFGPNLRPLARNADGTVTLADGTTIPASQFDPLTGGAVRPPAPAIANDGTAVATTDPANPNAGDTNIVPIDSLC